MSETLYVKRGWSELDDRVRRYLKRYEDAKEIARLTAEVERLMEQLRLTQIDWNNVATENAGLQAVVDAARALLKLAPPPHDDAMLGCCEWCDLRYHIRAYDAGKEAPDAE